VKIPAHRTFQASIIGYVSRGRTDGRARAKFQRTETVDSSSQGSGTAGILEKAGKSFAWGR
jgi:hypothetical protein